MKKIDGIYRRKKIKKTKRIDGPHAPKELSKITFEQLLIEMTPEIEYLARKWDGFLEGYDRDDVFQELSFKLWNIFSRRLFPSDMLYVDYRCSKFLNKSFTRRILDIKKLKYDRYKREERVFKDILDISLPLNDDFEKFLEK